MKVAHKLRKYLIIVIEICCKFKIIHMLFSNIAKYTACTKMLQVIQHLLINILPPDAQTSKRESVLKSDEQN